MKGGGWSVFWNWAWKSLRNERECFQIGRKTISMTGGHGTGRLSTVGHKSFVNHFWVCCSVWKTAAKNDENGKPHRFSCIEAMLWIWFERYWNDIPESVVISTRIVLQSTSSDVIRPCSDSKSIWRENNEGSFLNNWIVELSKSWSAISPFCGFPGYDRIPGHCPNPDA